MTDWHDDDYYKAITKIAILSKVTDVQFVDISHNIQHFHISQAAFVLSRSLKSFPEGTIHFFGIQSANTNETNIIVGEFNKQYIIANDNGIFNALNLHFDQLIAVNSKPSNFPEAELFSPIALKIIEGKKLSEIGTPINKTQTYSTIQPFIEENNITCPISFIDTYGNIILNIHQTFFEEHRKGRPFEILINSMKHKTNTIHTNYNDVPKSEIFSIFNSSGLLEIGMRMANISQILNLSEKSSIIIKFYDH